MTEFHSQDEYNDQVEREKEQKEAEAERAREEEMMYESRLMDEFAMIALAETAKLNITPAQCADACYQIADAMVAARRRFQGL